jgi:hypothetical protein
VTVRGLGRALVLLLLPVAMAAATDVSDWSDAPSDWVAGLDYSAFCRPGEWFFEPTGKFAVVNDGMQSQPQDIPAAAAFFRQDHKGAAVWTRHGPKSDELTRLRITRGEESGLMMEAFAGETLAVRREFKYVRQNKLLWSGRKKSTQCEPGKALLIELDNYSDSWSGGSSVQRARLALAADGALIVRFDSYTCWLCLSKNRSRRYARFPMAPVKAQLPPTTVS